MGTYLNPGNIMFQKCLNSEIYVDKTELIRYTNSFLNTENNLICVSRPRRFGKSMALKMLAAYYSKDCDSRTMFENLKLGDFGGQMSSDRTGNGQEDKAQTDIFLADSAEKDNKQAGCAQTDNTRTADGYSDHVQEQLKRDAWTSEEKKELFEKGLNRYDTLYIDMQGIIGICRRNPRFAREIIEFEQNLPHLTPAAKELALHPLLTAVQCRVIQDIRRNPEYAGYIPEDETFLGNALLSVYQHTGNQFILLIDEWDCIFRNQEDNRFLQDNYIDLLRDLFKNTELIPAYALVYMTGILPVKRYGTQSALNNFKEYTMLDMSPLEAFTGFTEEETAALYEKYGMDFRKAQEWYDGYQLEDFGHIYNPNSVIQSITRRKFNNYWTATGTYGSVKQPIDMDFDGLKEKVITMLGGGRCSVNTSRFQNDMTTFRSGDDVLTLLIHLGYLGYDSARKEVYIPNKEIRDEFVNAINGSKWTLTYAAIDRSEKLLEATLDGDAETVAECIAKVHEDNTSILTYNDENSLSCVIQLAYYKAQDDYWMVRELPAGKGFADIAFIPRRGVTKPAMVAELKWKKDAQTAIDQIYARNYSGRMQDYFGEILLVGINYEKGDADKTHTCRIERVYRK